MTLREIRDITEEAPKTVRVPSVRMVLDQGSPAVSAKAFYDGALATVYRNGLVIYRNGSHATVFRLHACGDYKYRDMHDVEYITPFEAFLDQPWQMRIMMEGEKRLVHNMNARRINQGELSFEELAGRRANISDHGAGDPLRILIEEEERKEAREKMYSALGKLPERHRYIVMECVVKGRKQVDVARELGTSRRNVSAIMSRALNKVRLACGSSGQAFGRNQFYREESTENL